MIITTCLILLIPEPVTDSPVAPHVALDAAMLAVGAAGWGVAPPHAASAQVAAPINSHRHQARAPPSECPQGTVVGAPRNGVPCVGRALTVRDDRSAAGCSTQYAANDLRRRRAAVRLPRMSLVHTCYRITDIERSVKFYEALGFEERGRFPIRDEAINVFMSLPDDGPDPRLELTYNIGREEPYEIGTGYGHIAITTPDLDGALARLANQGIEPERPPYTVSEGGNRLCFVRDPDQYRIEIIEHAG
jgi:lactoylglutathione lyase